MIIYCAKDKKSMQASQENGSDNLPYEKIGKETRCIADEIPFDIPDSWEWSRIGSCMELVNGRAYKQSELQDKGKYRVLRVGNFFTNSSWYYSDLELPPDKYCQRGDLLYAWSASFGPRIWDQGKAIFHYHIWNVKFDERLFLKEFLFYFLLWDKERLKGSTTGSTMIHISMEHMYPRLIMIPPLPEQQRIVGKIEELLPHLEEYDQAETRVKKLNAEFPEQLKKSILQWAIQGKLVPQDPNDEPASVLLDHIRAEKAKLIKAGKIKKDKMESVIFRRDNSHYEKLNGIERCIDDEIPFEIPDSWAWVRLSGLLIKLTDGTHFTPKYTAEGVPFLSVKNISTGRIKFDNVKFISEAEHRTLFQRCNPEKDDILLTKVGTTGIPVLVDCEIEFSIFVSIALLKFAKQYIDKYFFVLLLKSPLVQNQCSENTKGVGNKNWVMKDIAKTLLAIPPLAEQKRIVAEIEKILSLQRTMRR